MCENFTLSYTRQAIFSQAIRHTAEGGRVFILHDEFGYTCYRITAQKTRRSAVATQRPSGNNSKWATFADDTAAVILMDEPKEKLFYLKEQPSFILEKHADHKRCILAMPPGCNSDTALCIKTWSLSSSAVVSSRWPPSRRI